MAVPKGHFAHGLFSADLLTKLMFLGQNEYTLGWFRDQMDLMDTSKSSRGHKIRFYASTRVPLKTRNVFDIVGFDVEVEVEDDA